MTKIDAYFAGIIGRAVRELMSDSGITIERSVSYTDKQRYVENISFKVNWSCMGGKDTDVARKFAKDMEKACDIADFLNGFGLQNNLLETAGTSGRPISDDTELCKYCIRTKNTVLFENLITNKFSPESVKWTLDDLGLNDFYSAPCRGM